MLKCVPVLENRLSKLTLNHKQQEQQARLLQLLYRYQQEETINQLKHDRPAHLNQDRLEFLRSSQFMSDFWLSTSGIYFSEERAVELKAVGLVGIALPLHHYDPEQHNTIQGYKHAYGWVLKAADIARRTKLLVCLRLRPSENFISAHNLFAYTRLAKKIGATLIQVIDPVTQELCIKPASVDFESIAIMDDFTEMINYQHDFLHWPCMSYQLSPKQKTDNTPQPAKHAFYIDPTGRIYQSAY